MKSLKLRLSNGVPFITFQLLVLKIQKAKNLGFGSQIPYDLTHLGGQGRRGESNTLLEKFSMEKKLCHFESRIVVRSSPIFDDFTFGGLEIWSFCAARAHGCKGVQSAFINEK